MAVVADQIAPIDLSAIVMLEINRQHYETIRSSWTSLPKILEDDEFFYFASPVVIQGNSESSYFSLVNSLVMHPLLSKICVKENGCQKKYSRATQYLDHCKEEIAFLAYSYYKGANHIDAYFQLPPKQATLEVRFAEDAGNIVGYSLRFVNGSLCNELGIRAPKKEFLQHKRYFAVAARPSLLRK